MKKLVSFLLVVTLFFTLTSCLKTQHSVRIKNNYSLALRVTVATADFGLVSPGITTSYQNIPEGSSQLGGDLVGSVSVSGKGKVKWTVTINSSGNTEIESDN